MPRNGAKTVLIGDPVEAASVRNTVQAAFAHVPSPFVQPDSRWAELLLLLEHSYIPRLASSSAPPIPHEEIREWYFELPSFDGQELLYVVPRLMVDLLIDRPDEVRWIEELVWFLDPEGPAPVHVLDLSPDTRDLYERHVAGPHVGRLNAFTSGQAAAIASWLEYVARFDPVLVEGEIAARVPRIIDYWRLRSRV